MCKRQQQLAEPIEERLEVKNLVKRQSIAGTVQSLP
jgi:hypothetical protein